MAVIGKACLEYIKGSFAESAELFKYVWKANPSLMGPKIALAYSYF